MNGQKGVSLFHGLEEFGGAPDPSQSVLVGGVGHLGLHALGTEGKGKFVPVAIGQHGMVQFKGRENVHLGQPEVLRDVSVARVGQDLGMPDGVRHAFVHPRVKRRHIQVLYLFALGHVGLVKQSDGVGASAEKGVARLQGVHPVAGSQNVWTTASDATARSQSHSQMMRSWYPSPPKVSCFCWVASYISCRVRSGWNLVTWWRCLGKHRGHPCHRHP